MAQYTLFSLINGAEVIGKVTGDTDTTVTLEHPLVVRPIQKQGGGLALDLFPHSLAEPEGEHVFNKVQILSTSVTVPGALEKAYVERTSKIILAGALANLEKAAG